MIVSGFAESVSCTEVKESYRFNEQQNFEAVEREFVDVFNAADSKKFSCSSDEEFGFKSECNSENKVGK